jgi:hypothetical protein
VKFFRFNVFVYLDSDLMPRFFSSSHICLLWADGVLLLFREREHWRELCGQLKLEFHPQPSCSWSTNLTTSTPGEWEENSITNIAAAATCRRFSGKKCAKTTRARAVQRIMPRLGCSEGAARGKFEISPRREFGEMKHTCGFFNFSA